MQIGTGLPLAVVVLALSKVYDGRFTAVDLPAVGAPMTKQCPKSDPAERVARLLNLIDYSTHMKAVTNGMMHLHC